MMNYPLDTIAVLFQVFVFQLLSTNLMRDLTWSLALSRNPEWLTENPDFLKDHSKPTEKSNYVAAILIAGVAIWMSISSIDYFYVLHVASALWMGAEYFLFDFVIYKRLEEKIPRPKRVASMNVRKLSDFIPN